MRNIESPLGINFPAASEIQLHLPIRVVRSGFNSGSNGTNPPAAHHRQRSAQQEPVPAISNPPQHGRETSVSSTSSGYSLDRLSLASSATSTHQPGTNRTSPTLVPTSPRREISRQLVPLETLHRTHSRMWPIDLTLPSPYPSFGPRSALSPHHHHGPVEPPLQGFAQPQRPLPEFSSLLPSLTPSNWIGPNAPGRQSVPASPVAASGSVSGVPKMIHPRSSTPRTKEDRARRSAKMAAKKQKGRRNLSKPATRILLLWFYDHIAHPYPTEDEKHMLMQQAGLQLSQVSGWGAREVHRAFADRACRSVIGSSTPDGGNSRKWTGRPRRRGK